MTRTSRYLLLAILLFPAAAVADDAGLPDAATLEAEGAIIGAILLERRNVFDLADPEEDNALFRLANRLHIVTREKVIRQQLLFREGEPYSERLVEESARILRRNDYFYDARIRAVRYENGVVDLQVTTRDLWTLMPGFSISRKGGENRARVSLSETNLLGGGARIKLAYVDDVDRESTSLEYADRNLGDSWRSLLLRYSDNSDGEILQVALAQPFYALDTRNAWGLSFYDGEFETRFYALGEEVAEYRSAQRTTEAWIGRSSGLVDGWVRRLSVGLTRDERRFAQALEPTLPALLPEDRELTYPWVGIEWVEDDFETSSNRDQIERTEDFFMGTRIGASLGYASADAGSDRDAFVFRAAASRGFGSMGSSALLLGSNLSGRVESGTVVNALWQVDSRYYRQLSERSLVFTTLAGAWGRRLDLDNPLQLGGDNGLRGYPLRYQVGEQRLLLSAEYRYFTDWYPFRLARVGGAVFADAGRTWGANPAGGGSLGWLTDVGIGLRFAPTRASGREVIHLDIAFPLDGDPTIDDVQLLLESKRSF